MAPELKLYAICSAVLTLQMLFLGALTAATRARHNGYLSPEDGKVSRANATHIDGAEHPDTARVLRAHRNLLESLPLFFGLGLVYVLAGAPVLGAQICFIGFTAARVVHAFVYLHALQPWRTIAYALGSFCLLGMIAMILRAVLMG
jgi:prostaglandin-E synthase 1